MGTIEQEFEGVLRRESPGPFGQAGAMWREAPLSFYYPGSEIAVDQAIISVTRTQLTPGTNLPQHVWNNLRLMINGATRVREAIPIIGSALVSAIEDASRES